MTKEFDCRQMAEEILNKAKERVEQMGIKPQLHIAVVESKLEPGDWQYIHGIEKSAAKIGAEIVPINHCPDGVVYVGKSWRKSKQLFRDIDGVSKDSSTVMCVTEATIKVLTKLCPSVAGTSALVIGRGKVGRQIANELLDRGATVTVTHSKTEQSTMAYLMQTSSIIAVAGATGLDETVYSAIGETVVLVDLTGGNQYLQVGSGDLILVRHIGALTRAILMGRLVSAVEHRVQKEA